MCCPVSHGLLTSMNPHQHHLYHTHSCQLHGLQSCSRLPLTSLTTQKLFSSSLLPQIITIFKFNRSNGSCYSVNFPMYVSFPFCDKSGNWSSLLTQESAVLSHRSSQLLRQRCRYHWSCAWKRWCHWFLHS
jgi:hypothetical protein